MNTWKLEPRFYTRTRVFGHECTRARGRNRKPRSSRITTGAICSLSLSLPPWPTLDTPPIPEWTHVWPTQAEYTQAILYLLNDARYLEEAMRVYPGVSARPIVASLNVQREALVVDGWTRFGIYFVLYGVSIIVDWYFFFFFFGRDLVVASHKFFDKFWIGHCFGKR